MRVVSRRRATLDRFASAVDTISMSDASALSTDQQDLICILAAYQAAQLAAPGAAVPAAPATTDVGTEVAEANDDTGWVPRLRELPNVAAERLAPLHGQLIAHGLLKFNLLGRTQGVGYRVTPEGREVLARMGTMSASTV